MDIYAREDERSEFIREQKRSDSHKKINRYARESESDFRSFHSGVIVKYESRTRNFCYFCYNGGIMEKIYKFKGKGLFILAGIICLFTVFGVPFGIMLFYMAAMSKIVIKNDVILIKMLVTKEIKFDEITGLRLAKSVSPKYYIAGSGGFGWINCAKVIPFIIECGDKKVKFSLNFFENSKEIVQTLVDKTGLKLRGEKE